MGKKNEKWLDTSVLQGEKKVLVHACCAPCSSAILEQLLKMGLEPAIFYSNSNIYPSEEYIIRREECRRYADDNNVEFIEDDYNHGSWQCVCGGLGSAPERGPRCLQCFRFRMERAAAFAYRNGYSVVTTTLASSRWKSLEQVNAAGEYACSLYPGVRWWDQNWRKGGLQERRNQIIKEKDFYNQLYCGCEFSFRKEE